MVKIIRNRGSSGVAEDKKQGEGKEDTSEGMSWPVVLGLLASIVTVLTFLGITNFGQLWHKVFRGPTPTNPAAATYNPVTYSPVPVTSIATSSAALPTPNFAADSTTPPVTSAPTAFDPFSLDNSSTDQTPFTVAALLPETFQDSRGVRYRLVAAGPHACGGSYSMSSNVQYVLNNYTCTQTMTGDYLVDSPTVNSGNDILVSVQVFPFGTATTALDVANSFPTGGSWDFGIWCPPNGTGVAACSSGYGTAQKREYLWHEYRYVIEATAVYTDLNQDSSSQVWVTAAAQQAVDVSGPQNYAGNH